jgi:zinc/manganese transport system substrate-binding protein
MILIIDKDSRKSNTGSRRSLRNGALLLAMLLGLGACATNDRGDDGILVVATTSILGDIASNVIGEEGTVEVLIPIGADSHDFVPSAQQATLLAEADLLVANGLGLEEAVEDLLESTMADGTTVIEMAPLVAPLPYASHGHKDEGGHVDEEDGRDHDSEDPHFWMDPIRVGEAALALAKHLSTSNPDGAWLDRATAYAERMGAADRAIQELLEEVPEDSRKMVTNHEAFGYFADRYGFDIIGVVIPGGSTLAEPSSADLAALVEEMERERVRVIFAETSQPSALAEAVAAELGDDVDVVELFTESLGPPGSGAETLEEMLLTNAERIAGSLR